MRSVSRIPSKTGGKVRLDDGKFGKFSVRLDFGTSLHSSQTCPRRSGLANNHEQTQSCLQSAFIWRMSVKTPDEGNYRSCRCDAPQEEQALDIVDEVRQPDLRLRSRDPDGPDEQTHPS